VLCAWAAVCATASPASPTPLDAIPVGDPLEAELRILDVLGPGRGARHLHARPLQVFEIDSIGIPADDPARALALRRIERFLLREPSLRPSSGRATARPGATLPWLRRRPAPATQLDLSAGIEGSVILDEDRGRAADASGLHLRGALAIDRWLAYTHLVAGEFGGSRGYADPIVAGTDVTTLTEESYLAYAGDRGRWSAMAGRGRWHWGPGEEGSLVLSKSSPAITGVALRASVPELGLDLVVLDATLAASAGEQLAAHRIEWQPLDGLRLGVTEAARYRADGWRPLYAIGVIPYVLVQRLEVRDEPDSAAGLRNNVMVGFDAAWRVAPGTRLTGELLVDDLHSKTDDNPDKLAFQLGLEGAGTALGRRIAWGVEFTRLSRYVYTSFFGRAHAAEGMPLGFPTGPDARRVRVRVAADLGEDWQAVARATLTDRGEGALDDPYLPGSPRPSAFGFAGVVERERDLEAGLRWWPATGVDLALLGGYARAEDAGHAAGATRERIRATLAVRLRR
jgi:hypothetical protein